MNWSLKIARVAGIGIYLHWTFLLLLGWLYFSADTRAAGLMIVGLVVAVFACVALHELGHALTARAYGVRTLHITLLPIGGIARLERIPQKPWQEFWVAVAGPAVNVVIAAILLAVIVVLVIAYGIHDIAGVRRVGGVLLFLGNLLLTNVALVVFNMLPAFPMDGGRVLRSLLATRLSRLQATRIAANVGQVMAALFIFVGLWTGQWMLVFIAMFVFMAGKAELQAVEVLAVFQDKHVRDAMTSGVLPVEADAPLEQVGEAVAAGYQHDFPVVKEGRFIGMLHHAAIAEAQQQHDVIRSAESLACRHCPILHPNDPLATAVQQLQASPCTTLPVLFEGQVVGLLTSRNIVAWAAVERARHEQKKGETRVLEAPQPNDAR